MSAQQQLAKLQGLLERIKKNAKSARAAAPVATAANLASAAPNNFSAVDDLLEASPAPSPLPVEVDVTLESVPPDADAAAIPLVSSGGKSSPPVDDTLGMEDEVSEVRVTTGLREPATEVTVAAIEAEAEPIGAEELSEDDLVEVTDLTSVPPPVATGVDIDFEDEDERPPASSQRSKVASSMDEALAAAAAQMEAEREVPIKTPPPDTLFYLPRPD